MKERIIRNRFWIILLTGYPFIGFTQDFTKINSDTVFCSDTRIIFNSRYSDDSSKKISFVHVHENETTAVDAVTRIFDSVNNGCFVTWQCQQQRFVNFKLNGVTYHFDPNRIYTTVGISATLRSNNGAYSNAAANAIEQVAKAFLKKYVDSNLLVVAMHNNTDVGRLSVNSYKKNGVYSRDAKQVFINLKQDADDFFYTTGSAHYSFLKSKGFNVVLQDDTRVKNDGSLSVYCASKKIPYINIEAQEGHLEQQTEMLKAVLELINQFGITQIHKYWAGGDVE